MCYLVFYSFLCWFHFPSLMFLSFCLLDVICCEGHCVLLENRWHSFSLSYLFIFISWFSFWQMVTLVWCTVEFLKFILDTVYNRFPVNFFGVLVERVIYDFSEMFSAPQVFNCILVTRSMVWKCYTVVVVCELTEIWGWQETQNHIHPPLVILELAWGKFLQSRGIMIIMLWRHSVG